MKTRASNLILLATMFIVVNSCNRPECKNTNPTFNKFAFDTDEYKRELAKEMQSIGIENLSYRFENYKKKDNKEFIIINILGKELCVKGEIQVNDWDKISGMRREISGYRGAELKGLKIKIEADSTGTKFLYDDIDRVID